MPCIMPLQEQKQNCADLALQRTCGSLRFSKAAEEAGLTSNGMTVWARWAGTFAGAMLRWHLPHISYLPLREQSRLTGPMLCLWHEAFMHAVNMRVPTACQQ